MPSLPTVSSNALGIKLLESVWIGFSFTAIVIAARIYTRVIIVRNIIWDDFFMFAAFSLNLVSYILTTKGVSSGFGLHTNELAEIDPSFVAQAMKWALLGQVLGVAAGGLARMSFITTLLAIISPTQKTHLWLLRAFFVIQFIINSIVPLYILLQCHPIQGLWDPTSGAKCLPPSGEEHLGYGQATINSFTDLTLAIVPGSIIWRLNLKKSLKISLSLTMSLSVFALIVSIIKAVNLTDISASLQDPTHAMFGLQFWMGVEIATLIVAATIPTLRPIFSRRNTAPQTDTHCERAKHSYKRWGSSIDQVELTSSGGDRFAANTECAVDEETLAGVTQPRGAIMRTVSASVTY